MPMTIHFKDGTTATNSSWQQAHSINSWDILITGGGGIVLGMVPACNVQWIDFVS